jgi:adenosine deaminase
MLEMSFDIRLVTFYPDGLTELRAFIEALVEQYQTEIDLRPELGFARECADDPRLMNLAHQAIELGSFQSIDLYSHQEGCAPEAVKPLYRKAREAGMKLKAHIGEFGGAEEVQRTVEVLDLDEVQHGIGAAESVEVMRWLSENQTQLNVCPTSNVMLDAVPDLASHPIRILFDNGVPVTINTDDLMIFGQSVSEEYRNLYRAGVFSAEELDDIRRASLEVLD